MDDPAHREPKIKIDAHEVDNVRTAEDVTIAKNRINATADEEQFKRRAQWRSLPFNIINFQV